MTSNMPPSASGQPPRVMFEPSEREFIIKSGQMQTEQKNFLFLLKENSRGRFLRVTERSGEHFANIIVPATGLTELLRVLEIMIAAAQRPICKKPNSRQFSLPEGEHALLSEKLRVERKIITFLLIENPQGRFLHLTEKGGGHINQLILSVNALADFRMQMNEMVKASSEQPFPFNPPHHRPPQAAWVENVLASVLVPVERKSFMLLLKENRHGRFLRITERAGRDYSCIFIPVGGLGYFIQLLDEMIQTAGEPAQETVLESHRSPNEITLNHARMQVKGKTFVLRLKENMLGRYLRLIEESPDCDRASIVIPAGGLVTIRQEVEKIIKISNAHPLKHLP